MSDYIKGVYVKKTKIVDGKLNYNYILNENENGFFRTKFQFERQGYFCTDSKDSKPDGLVFNRIIGLRDSWAKAAGK